MKFLSALVSLFFLGCFVAFGIAFLVILHYSVGLPDYEQLAVYKPPVTSRLYAADGSVLAEYATEKRIFVPVEDIPPMVRHAFLSAEDKNFYRHGGIDLTGIARAVLVNIKNLGTGRRPVGASTITQQVAKNFLLSSERSLSRKIREALLAHRMEQAFTKDHILELYLNEIYLGQGAYGVASASLAYFNKAMDELTLAEMAYLAALPKAPNNYHPVKNKDAAMARRNWVLDRMAEDGYISKEQAESAKQEDLIMTAPVEDIDPDGAYYAEEVRRFVVDKYGDDAIYHGGLFIQTSLNPELQKAATKALQNGLLNYDRRHGWRGPLANVPEQTDAKEVLEQLQKKSFIPEGWELALVENVTDAQADIYINPEQKGIIQLSDLEWARKALEGGRISRDKITKVSQVLNPRNIIYVQKLKKGNLYALKQVPEVEGALVAMDPHTGRVLAMAGGFSFQKNQFNRAVQAYRQPGSSFKPFVYLTALDAGYTPSSLILDAPLVMTHADGTKWKPKNYTKIFYGPTTLRVGIEKSRNLMTIRLAQAIGVGKMVQYGKKFGISDKLEPNLSTALGSGETTLLRLTNAYAILVGGGKALTPNLIDRIQDRDGKTIYKHDTRVCPNCSGEEADAFNVPVVTDERPQIQDPISAYQMVNILTGVVERGTGRVAKSLKKTLGAKSGTSNDSFDAWFIGFSPDLVVGVWVGFDIPKTLGPNDTGGVVAGPIFRDFMAVALKDAPNIPFRVPAGVRLVRVDATTGALAKPGDKNVILEAFRANQDPNQKQIIGEDITITDDEAIPDIGGLY